MKYLILMLVSLSACSSGPVRKTEKMEKWTAPEMRVAVYAPYTSEMAQAQIEEAIQMTGKFWIVSRGDGLDAIFKEQEMTHREQMDRFENREKWAHWGKAHGVGAIIFGREKCNEVISFGGGIFKRCQQSLSMIDATSGEILATALEIADGEVDGLAPSWNEVSDKLMKRIPKMWVEKVYEGRAAERQIASEEHGKSMQKKHAVKAMVSEE